MMTGYVHFGDWLLAQWWYWVAFAALIGGLVVRFVRDIVFAVQQKRRKERR